MAIHKDHPGLTVAIVTRGRSAREYDDVDASDSDKIIAKYIQAYANAEFMIRVTFDVPFPADKSVVMCIWVDGKVIARPIISTMKKKRPMEFVYDTVRKVIGEEGLGRKLVFGALNIGEYAARVVRRLELTAATKRRAGRFDWRNLLRIRQLLGTDQGHCCICRCLGEPERSGWARLTRAQQHIRANVEGRC
jgi:hypothetical protein